MSDPAHKIVDCRVMHRKYLKLFKISWGVSIECIQGF